MKTSLIILRLLATLLTGAGCAAAGQKLDDAKERVEEKLDTAEDSAEQSLRRILPSMPAEASPAPDPITKEKAEEIALRYLDLTRDQVRRLRTDYEIDNGTGQYDVQFISGDWEYEFEIHAETGNILSFGREHKYD